MCISPAIKPSFLFILAFNSLAALSVNVVTRIVFGSTSFWFIKCNTLSTKTHVLPAPGPATISKGPLKCSIASFCFCVNELAIVMFVSYLIYLKLN
ncbi:MAG: hypothetical protein A4E27_00334 [Methanobacterium sp. PtaU1.Bin242]|nr:MAG: hypothetical protein A4E27_00334 [Methanobacterium sp. PtaU1.Bin242]